MIPPALGDLTIPSRVDVSYLGGAELTVTGPGLAGTKNLMVGSMKAELISSDAATSSYTYRLPPYPTKVGNNYIALNDPAILKPVIMVADNQLARELVSDNEITSEYSSTNAVCFFGIIYDQFNFVSAVRFFIPFTVAKPAEAYFGVKIQGSVTPDFATAVWQDIQFLNGNVEVGWNTLKFLNPVGPYNKIRFVHDLTSSGLKQTSGCRIGQFEVYGSVGALPAPTSGTVADFAPTSTLMVSDEVSYDLTGNIHYVMAATPRVTEVSPKFGNWKANTTVTITGTGFSATPADVSVMIDNVTCTVTASSAT